MHILCIVLFLEHFFIVFLHSSAYYSSILGAWWHYFCSSPIWFHYNNPSSEPGSLPRRLQADYFLCIVNTSQTCITVNQPCSFVRCSSPSHLLHSFLACSITYHDCLMPKVIIRYVNYSMFILHFVSLKIRSCVHSYKHVQPIPF